MKTILVILTICTLFVANSFAVDEVKFGFGIDPLSFHAGCSVDPNNFTFDKPEVFVAAAYTPVYARINATGSGLNYVKMSAAMFVNKTTVAPAFGLYVDFDKYFGIGYGVSKRSRTVMLSTSVFFDLIHDIIGEK
jgi:hypothetical protein